MNPITFVMRDPQSLIPYEQNAKRHEPKQVAGIAKSLQEFGWDQPIVVDKGSVIIKGHGRRLAALKLGLTEVPVIVRDDLTEDQVKAARLADNRVALGQVDADMLQRELKTISMSLEGIFDPKELDFLNADLSTINADAFSLNLDEEVTAQTAETANVVREIDERPVRIDVALGFKSIQVKDQRVVASFMAEAEHETGMTGSIAFVAYLKKLAEEKAEA